MVAKSVQNILNYLSDKEYDEKTLFNDIDIVATLAHAKYPFEGHEEYKKLFSQMVYKRANECLIFFNSHYKEYPSYVLEWLDLYDNYPFRKSRNPKADRDLMFKTIGFDNSSLDCISELQNIIAGFVSYAGIQIPDDFERKSYNTIGNYGMVGGPLTIDNLRNARYVSRISDIPFPETKEEARDLFNASQDRENTGNFGEYLAMDYIIEHKEPGDEIHWVSKDIGDGFGFDVLIYNSITGKITVYEIKANNFEEEFIKNNLTTTEEACKFQSEDPNNNFEFIELRLLLAHKIADFEPTNYIIKMDITRLENQQWNRKRLIDNMIAADQLNEAQKVRKNI